MPEDPLERVLRLVAEGRLTAEEAEPILDALETGRYRPSPPEPPEIPARPTGAPRYARIEVTEGGRRAVDLRIPLSLGRRALSRIPGLTGHDAAELDEAVSRGHAGPLLDITDDDGDGVRIALE
jgi:hypothetical protein